MKKAILMSLLCAGMLLGMVSCSAGDNGADMNSTELTGQTLENNQDTTEGDLQTDGESELDASQTDDVQETVTEPDAATTDETVEEDAETDAMTENQTAEGTEAEPIPEEPEVEMVDFETWAKQEGNEDCCLVVWNEAMKTQKIMEDGETYVIQEGDRFAIPYRENYAVDIHVDGNKEVLMWDILDYTELHLPDAEEIGIVIVDYINLTLKYYELLKQ